MKCELLLCALITLVGCGNSSDDNETPQNTIEINPTSISVVTAGGEQDIAVKSTAEWAVVSSQPLWCKLSSEGGLAGSSSVKVTVLPNTTEAERNAVVTFRSGTFRTVCNVTQNAFVNTVAFADAAFEQYCKMQFDANKDGMVAVQEVSSVTALNVASLGISSLQGIENFTALKTLDCSGNSLASLDVAALTQLTSLNCADNQLEELDIKSMPSISILDCTGNAGLSKIYVWTGFDAPAGYSKPAGAEYVEPEIATPIGYSLVWNDEFNDAFSNGKAVLPSSEWTYETGNGGWGNNEIQNYIPAKRGSDTCAYISNGILKIVAKQVGSEVLSTRMNTSKSWTYGYFEARLKLPSGKGTWPAFWMMPKNFTAWPYDGEIDIMEEVGYHANYVSSSIHCQAYYHSIGTQKTKEILLPTAQSEFHVYALEWTEDYIKTYVDGNLLFSFANDKKGDKNTWPFNAPFYLKLNLAWGGNWGGAQGLDPTCLPATYEIDYVRVFQKK